MLFFDIETRSDLNLNVCGNMRYACHPTTEIIALCFILDGQEYTWAPQHRGGTADPQAVRVWNEYVAADQPVIAWNAQFDRTVLEHAQSPFAAPTIEQTVDAMAQAESYSLPGGLDAAAKALGLESRKLQGGKPLVMEFCDATKPWQPTREKLQRFWDYCIQDVRVMMEVWEHCRPWVASEWQDYHVVERMNARGVPIDAEFVAAAAELGARISADANQALQAFTGDPHMSHTTSTRKREWLVDKLGDSPLLALIQNENRTSGFSTGKNYLKNLRVQGNAAAAEDLPENWPEIITFINLVEDGRAASAAKFKRMNQLYHDGRLHYQYRCSPTITGRHASRGVQLDNVLRESLDNADQVIEATKRGQFFDAIEDMSPNRALDRLIRPTFTSDKGLTWGDWSSIEARILPWLAHSKGAEEYLDVFRAGGDIYKHTAAGIYAVPVDEVTKEQRFAGKVATLSLGYQGGAGALINMAHNYDAPMNVELAEEIKTKFRNANPWLVNFWERLKQAAFEAIRNPEVSVPAGRVRYIRLGPDLLCQLPCGRVITYPSIVWEKWWHKVWEKQTSGWRYRKKKGRGNIWGGVLAENITQGAAASLLRDLMLRLDTQGIPLLTSRHDEVLVEGDHVKTLTEEMLKVPSWAEGLPVAADVAYGARYGK